MSVQHSKSNFPKIHNAMWPGLVGKGSPGAEAAISFDDMLEMTAQAEVDGIRFDGIDLFLHDPHISIDIDEDGIKKLAEKIQARGFVVGSVVAPVWGPTGGGSAMGGKEERQRFVEQVRKACAIAKRLRSLGVRPYGVVRIDSAASVEEWSKNPEANQRAIVETFEEACTVAESFGERLAAEGEICWGGMHSWKKMLDLLERVNRPQTLGFQADMAHTLLYIMGYNAPEDALVPADYDWSDPHVLDHALKTLTNSLRPWTIDFHVAQNDGTVKGSGSHDKTGHHCLPNDPEGKLRIAHHAGYWLHGDDGKLTRSIAHICWDGCMFPNAVMKKQETWNEILQTMIAVRDAHGWRDDDEEELAEARPLAPIEIERLESPKSKDSKPRSLPRSSKPKARPTKLKASASSSKPKPKPKPKAKAQVAKRKTAKKPAPKKKISPKKLAVNKPTKKKKTTMATKAKAKKSAKKPAKSAKKKSSGKK